MKKGTISLAVILVLSQALTSCSSSPEETPASSSATVSESTAASTNSTVEEPEDSTPTSDSTEANGISVEVLVSTEGDSRLEYVQISGLPDQAVTDKLNAELETFFTWPLTGSDGESTYENTADWTVVGDQYVSVRSLLTTVTTGAAYPTNSIQTNVFSLNTGESAGSLSDFIIVGEGLKNAIDTGLFKQTHPEESIDGASEALASEIVDSPIEYDTRFYLTTDSFGLYLPDRLHAAGDYWTFEAKYTDIETLLTENLKTALQ